MTDPKQEQIEIAERLQVKILRRFEKSIDDGTIQATEVATLVRLLASNGWNIDPAKVPASLRGMLTSHISASDIDEDDPSLRSN